MRRLGYELHRAKNDVQVMLFQNPEELQVKYKEQQRKLTIRRLDLRRKQGNCFRSRRFLHYKGYRCFKPKKRAKENEDTKDNQDQVLDSYF